MDGGFFERFGSGLRDNFKEDTIIAEKDKFVTLNAKEISDVDKDTAERTQLSFKELLSSLLELNVIYALIIIPTVNIIYSLALDILIVFVFNVNSECAALAQLFRKSRGGDCEDI